MRNIVTIDCDYMFPQYAASYLMIDGDRALFIENNTTHAVPKLMEALESEGLVPAQVEYLIVTHVHLDHAGGTSALLKNCPNATVLAHPKAAKRIIDPSRLIQSARQVYGDKEFDKLYGEILPVPAEKVRAIKDEEVIHFGSRDLRFFYTLGHASHHFCIYDSLSNSVFTGDSFGVMYPALQKEDEMFIIPSTSPVDFDPTEARLTHYGELTDIDAAKAQLNAHLDVHERLLHEAQLLKNLTGTALADHCATHLREYFKKYFELKKYKTTDDTWALLKLDIDLNGAGIAHAAEKRRAEA
jgi:glyoxylase-like metal-dependent hydrolase (beta-lactamase superfamily II)